MTLDKLIKIGHYVFYPLHLILFLLSWTLKAYKQNSVLIIELNSCHSEVLLGVEQHFRRNNFQTEFLLNYNLKYLDIFCNTDRKKYVVKFLPYWFLVKLINSNYVKFYDFVFFSSSVDYQKNKLLFLCHKISHSPKFGFLYLEHDKKNIRTIIETTSLYNEGRVCFLGKKGSYPELTELPCFYYGEIESNGQKGKKIRFLIAGVNSRDVSYYISLAIKLKERGINNFCFDITGYVENRNKITERIQELDLKSYIILHGRVSFKKLHTLAKHSNFMIAPENIEAYINYKVSGTRQLSLGFCKPMVISNNLAQDWGIDRSIAITYSNNMFEGVHKALTLSMLDYEKLVSSMEEFAIHLFNQTNSEFYTNLKNIKNTMR